ncbi:hypothetical protein Hte_008857 [Hypoxylon texense]
MAQLPPSVEKSLKETKVEYRLLGKSGLRVSVPIVGCMSIGSPEWADWVIGPEKALPLLKAAYDAGVNTWDTANIYSNGESERVIAQAIREYKLPRHKLVIMTKAWSCVGEEQFHAYPILNQLRQTKDYVNQFAVDASLKRLETDYIDVFWIHRFDPFTPIEETMQALDDLIRCGKIRYIGASSMWTYQFAMMQFCAEKNGWTKFVAMQWGPLAQGQLARPLKARGTTARSAGGGGDPSTTRPEAVEIISRVEELANRKGWTMSQVALAWTLKRVTSPIIGFSSVGRMDEALSARGKELTAEEEKYLEEAYTPLEVEGHF